MQDKVTSNNGKVVCLECKNEFDLDSSLQVGDVVECEYCGIEYDVVKCENGVCTLQVIEEEK